MGLFEGAVNRVGREIRKKEKKTSFLFIPFPCTSQYKGSKNVLS